MRAAWTDDEFQVCFHSDHLFLKSSLSTMAWMSDFTPYPSVRHDRGWLRFRAVAEADRSAGGVDDELLHEVAGNLALVGEQQALQFTDVGEMAAIGQGTGRVYRAGWNWNACPFLPM